MSKSWNRTETWVGLIVAAVGVLLFGLLGLWGYMSATSEPLHPNPAGVSSASRETPPPPWAGAVSRAEALARAAVSEQNLPGLSVAVGVGGALVWAEGFGWADIEKRTQVSPETRFRIGTASTVLSSAAVGLLVERNQLGLDDEIQRHVPEFPRKPWPVTLEQLMGHVAGVRNDGGDEGPLYTVHCEQPTDAFEHFADRPLLFEPGTAYRYSSYGWIVVSAAVEAAARQPFLTFMREQVFEPLGMRDTAADAPAEHDEIRATPYFPRFAADPRYGPQLTRPLDYSCYAGASVFVSTPSDLVRFGLGVSRGMLIQPATLQHFQTSLRLASSQETGYGLGWDVETATLAGAPVRWVGHEGTSLGGMLASLIIVPDRDIVVAAISNTSYADTETLALGIAEAFAERGSPAATDRSGAGGAPGSAPPPPR